MLHCLGWRRPFSASAVAALTVAVIGTSHAHLRTDDNAVPACSLNGVRNTPTGLCQCDPGWRGSDCGVLSLGPAPLGGAYAYGKPFETTSWGGVALFDNVTGIHHLYVTEIGGKACGLHAWQGQSTVTHATASSELGPFTKVGVAIPHQAHNPQAFLWGGKVYIFHIGSGVSQGDLKACNESLPPSDPKDPPNSCNAQPTTCPLAPAPYLMKKSSCISDSPCNATHCDCGPVLASGEGCETLASCLAAGVASCDADPECHGVTIRGDCQSDAGKKWQTHKGGLDATVANSDWMAYTKPSSLPSARLGSLRSPSAPPPSTGSTLHVASAFDAPFVPVLPPPPKCNNPTPSVHPNGTLFLACTWTLHSAPRPEGPWVEVGPIKPFNGSATPNGHWEDPFLFFDRRGGWHILSHVYATVPYPVNPVAGHAFSVDGLNWTFSSTQPYTDAVARVDGTTEMFATLERPKLMFNDPADPHRPTALFNGASPVWDSSNHSDPCHQCGYCAHCKVTSCARGNTANLDWTYTLGRPVMAK